MYMCVYSIYTHVHVDRANKVTNVVREDTGSQEDHINMKIIFSYPRCPQQFLMCFEACTKLAQCVHHWEYILSQLTNS